MKRAILLAIIAIISMFSSACGDSLQNHTNAISQSNLDEKEKMFLSLAGSQYFAFDYVADKEYKWVDIWIDRYENGKKVGDTGKMSIQVEPGKKGMLIATVNEKESGISEWTMAISSGGSIGKGESVQSFSVKENFTLSSATSLRSTDIKIDDDEIALAGICYKSLSADGGSITSLTEGFFEDPDNHQEELIENALVYIVKCHFSKNDRRD